MNPSCQENDGARRRSSRRGGRTMGEEETGPALLAKVRELAAFVRESKYAVAYTGAGISTAAGIPDFRGPSGVWTLQAKGKAVAEPDFTKLNPTLTHDLLRVLIESGHFHHIVTQNIDSLHLRSGVPVEKQSELHGNYSLETCPVCETRYFRSHAVWKGLTTPATNPLTARTDLNQEGGAKPQRSSRRQVRNIDHRTGFLCEADSCSGELENSVVLFGESLPAKEVDAAWKHTDKADLALVLGSSLKVGPACDMPAQVAKNGGKLVIVNLQHTPFDGQASLVYDQPLSNFSPGLLEHDTTLFLLTESGFSKSRPSLEHPQESPPSFMERSPHDHNIGRSLRDHCDHRKDFINYGEDSLCGFG